MPDFLNAGGNMTPTYGRRKAYKDAEVRKLWMALRGTKALPEPPGCALPAVVPGLLGPTWITAVGSRLVTNYQSYPTDGMAVLDGITTLNLDGVITDGGDPDIFPGTTITESFGNYCIFGQYEFISGPTYTTRTMIVDVSGAPTVVGTYTVTGSNERGGPSCAFSSAMIGVVYTTGTFRTIDVTNPASPSLIGSGAVVAPNVSLLNCRSSTSSEALVTGTHGLVVVDVSTPTAPSAVKTYSPGFACWDAYRVNSQFIYCTTFVNDSIDILDVTGAATKIGEFTHELLDGAYNMLYHGGFLYVVSSFNNRILKLDISNPADPVLVGSVCVEESPRSLAIIGNYMAVPAYSIEGDTDGIAVFPLSQFR